MAVAPATQSPATFSVQEWQVKNNHDFLVIFNYMLCIETFI